jgi:hypothetical protein
MNSLKEDLFELLVGWVLLLIETGMDLLLSASAFTCALLSVFPTLWRVFLRVGREMKLPY